MNENAKIVTTSNNAFSENKFFNKIKNVFKIVGRGLTEKLLLLYTLFTDPDVPRNVKLVIASGLSYFILPFDSIPDFLVGIGFTDDLAVILGIVYMLTTHITDEHKKKAKEMTNEIFPQCH